MSAFISAAGVFIVTFLAVFFLGLFGGRKEPTAHGQAIIAQASLIAAFLVAIIASVVSVFL